MKLHLTYPSSEEGIKLIRLYKYLRLNTDADIIMTYSKNEFSELQLTVYLPPIANPTNRVITGYDNIRIALKSIFPTLFDLTPIKRIPLTKKNRVKIIDMLP